MQINLVVSTGGLNETYRIQRQRYLLHLIFSLYCIYLCLRVGWSVQNRLALTKVSEMLQVPIKSFLLLGVSREGFGLEGSGFALLKRGTISLKIRRGEVSTQLIIVIKHLFIFFFQKGIRSLLSGSRSNPKGIGSFLSLLTRGRIFEAF